MRGETEKPGPYWTSKATVMMAYTVVRASAITQVFKVRMKRHLIFHRQE